MIIRIPMDGGSWSIKVFRGRCMDCREQTIVNFCGEMMRAPYEDLRAGWCRDCRLEMDKMDGVKIVKQVDKALSNPITMLELED